LPTDVILVQPKSKENKDVKMEEPAKEYAHLFGDVEDRKACMHEMCLPPDYSEPVKDVSLEENTTREPVRKYPFTLDPFQRVCFLMFYIFYFTTTS
jgi:hypothetical protein